MLAGAAALVNGIAVGRPYPNGESLPTAVWLHVPLAFGLVLGVAGGAVFRRTRDLAALGAAMFAAVWTFAAELSSYGGSIPEKDQGGIGLVIATLFVVMVVPMFVGAHAGGWIRRQYGRPYPSDGQPGPHNPDQDRPGARLMTKRLALSGQSSPCVHPGNLRRSPGER